MPLGINVIFREEVTSRASCLAPDRSWSINGETAECAQMESTKVLQQKRSLLSFFTWKLYYRRQSLNIILGRV